MKKIPLIFALIIGLLTSASTAMAQTVNMSRYITLTVTNGAAIRLDFGAAAYGTSVRIVSGRNTYNITVGPVWYDGNSPSTFTVTAGASTITVYGDIIGFDCSNNGANLTALDPLHNTELRLLSCHSNQLTSLDVSKNTQLTALSCHTNQLTSLDVSKNTQLEKLWCQNNNLTTLDVSKNTQLTQLYCYDNKFTTATLDDIYCALPDRTGKSYGWIQPAYNSSSSNHATVLATNKTNATSKNWKVQYDNKTDIPTTTGTYVCSTPYPEPNMSRYITLTVAKDSAIRLDFKAAAANTSVRIVSGSNTQDITVGTDWYNNNIPSTYTVTAGASTMTVYGDIIGFDCSSNGANLTSLDVSHNTQLTELSCYSNRLTDLDVSKNTALKRLFCELNRLSSLDISKNAALMVLNCHNNSLNSLDISKNTQLETLYCSDNNFTTATLDDIYCALPDRTGKSYGWIQPVYNSSSSNHATVLATNAQNAITKNWKVKYYENDTDIPTTTGSYVCSGGSSEPNMDSYITLTVAKDSAIRLDFKAAAAATPVRIVSGSNTQDITVGTDWKGIASYTAGSTTMTVYGDITRFDCSGNGANLTAIDPSHNTQLTYLDCSSNPLSSLDVSKNTQLTELYCYRNQLSSLDLSKNTKLHMLICYGNNLSTQALDDIFCALPDRTGNTNGKIQPVYKSSSSNHATVLATNAANATAKNWKVQYYNDDTDIPTTTGTYVCGTPHLDTYITLTVKSGEDIKLDFKAAATNTPVRIVSGSNTQDITVGTSWTGFSSYTADGTTMTVYGNLTGFDCSKNGENLTALDASNNTQLMGLFCGNNNLSSLDVSKNTKLTVLSCFNNKLSRLDLSKNTQLRELFCYGNNFSTQALDAIYCALPDRTGKDNGLIEPVKNSSDPNHATVLATNAQNATAKNWKVLYDDGGADIHTTGSYDCSTAVAEASAEQALTLYPNPVVDVLYLSATARTIRIYNVYGIEVAHAADTDRVEVSHLPAGIYTVKADGTVAKMVKR